MSNSRIQCSSHLIRRESKTNLAAEPPATRRLSFMEIAGSDIDSSRLLQLASVRHKLSPRDISEDVPAGAASVQVASGPPIFLLPPDILYIIFLLSLHEDPLNLPTTISHVYSRWREVALQASTLWTQITFKHPCTAATIDKNAAWITRSGKVLLNIEIEDAFHAYKDAMMPSIVAGIVPAVHRWRTLKIGPRSIVDLPAGAHQAMYGWLRGISAPQLQVLDAGTIFEANPFKSTAPYELGPVHAPNLHRLGIRGSSFSWWDSRLLQGLDRLMVDHSCTWMSYSYWHVLRQAPHLRTLEVYEYSPWTLLGMSITRPLTPQLHNSLSCLSIAPVIFFNILPAFHLPALESLSLLGEPFPEYHSPAPIAPYRSHVPQLRRVTVVEAGDWSPAGQVLRYISIFSEFHSISTIAIRGQAFESGSVLSHILDVAPPTTDSVILEDCTLDGCSGCLRKMVESRMKEGATRVRSLRLYGQQEVSEVFTKEDAEWLEMNVPEFLTDVRMGD